jgi:hypothetical protein
MQANKLAIIPIINLSEDRHMGATINIIHPTKAMVLHTEKTVAGNMAKGLSKRILFLRSIRS